MKKQFAVYALASLAVFIGTPHPARADDPPVLRRRTSLDAGWRFQKGDPAGAAAELGYATTKEALLASTAGFISGAVEPLPPPIGADVSYVQPGFDDSHWRQLDLPHDWAIEGPFAQNLPGATGKLPWAGVGWYRQHFQTPATMSSPSGRRLYLDIDGAMAYAEVWCNGRFVGGWPYGYTSFRLDLTPFLRADGDNVLAIRLDNPPESSRWYPGSGIYRNVWLVETASLHVAHWGTQITTPDITADGATVDVSTTLENNGPAQDATLQTELFVCGSAGPPTGQPVATLPAQHVTLPAAGRQTTESSVRVPSPQVWDTDNPHLYVAVTTVVADQQPIDRDETVFGIRTIEFSADRGFLLNGKHVPIHGVCEHSDLGALGTAVDRQALARQFTLLKEMGCNAVRTSHNPPAPEWLEVCDQLGILVMDEAFDCWQTGKVRNDYHLLFDAWHEKDLRALVRRDRNHPSVVLWSIGNEIPDQGTPAGPALAASLTHMVHAEDPTRPTTVACDRVESGYNDFHKGVDVFGYNYKPDEYRKFHAANPTQPVLGTETSAAFDSRGQYYFPYTDNPAGGLCDFQVSSYSFYYWSFSTGPVREFKGLDEAPFVAGEFAWCGLDYLGEPTPYDDGQRGPLRFTDPLLQAYVDVVAEGAGKPVLPARSSYFGMSDLAGFPKDRYYLYQSRWRPDYPMAHLLPHWNWPGREGEITPVHVYTSGDAAELFLNGESLGRKQKGAGEYLLRWDEVKYAPGELKVVAYKNGEPWATDIVRTAGPPAKILLQPEPEPAGAGGPPDLVYVHAIITDAQGVPEPRATTLVHFSVAGPAQIVATDNGDAVDQTKFQGADRRAFGGRCLAIVRTNPGVNGPVTLQAQADGLPAAIIPLGGPSYPR